VAGLRPIDISEAERLGNLYGEEHPELDQAFKVFTVENEHSEVAFRVTDVVLHLRGKGTAVVAPIGIPYAAKTLLKPSEQLDLHSASRVYDIVTQHKHSVESVGDPVSVEYAVYYQPEPETTFIGGKFCLFVPVTLTDVSGSVGIRYSSYDRRSVP